MQSLKDAAVLSELVAKKNAEIAALKKKLLELSSEPKYTQEDLDEYTTTHSLVDCLDFYDWLKEKGLDVYMIPVEKSINNQYRYFNSATGEFSDVEHADYRRLLENYEKSMSLSPPPTMFCGKGHPLPCARKGNPDYHYNNPNHKYLYTFSNPWILHNTSSLELFNFNIRRIYTLSTWNQEMPTAVRNLIYRMEQLVCIDKADKLKDLEEKIKNNPAQYPNPKMHRNNISNYYTYPIAFVKCHEKLYDLLLDHLLDQMPTQSM